MNLCQVMKTNFRGFEFKRKPFIPVRLLKEKSAENLYLTKQLINLRKLQQNLVIRRACSLCVTPQNISDSCAKLISRLFQYSKVLQMGKKDS